jgi:hypothetical protein
VCFSYNLWELIHLDSSHGKMRYMCGRLGEGKSDLLIIDLVGSLLEFKVEIFYFVVLLSFSDFIFEIYSFKF